ncbi:MAG TPA: hypothetical protein VGS61_06375 [Acidimicrobiales bacterium]|nr:hypothetical protein [Acidimicrobiales bacterium]
MRGRATLALAGAIGLTVALTGSALAAPAGAYRGTTTEKGTVTFTVAAHAVLNFKTTDGYNESCHFSGGVGGLRNYAVAIHSMALSATGRFTGRVTVSNTPFPGTAVVVVSGRFEGAKAFGTVTAVGHTCGTGSPTPTASMYYESFSATRA